ncbi:MAG: hypothetical protein KA974_01215 [Saprospiraceae bacterium]|nr:hypothetical protein [Saprospiraceae bacterium]
MVQQRYIAQIISLLLVMMLCMQCSNDPTLMPRPRAYPRVIYPPKTYQAFDTSFCRFTFEYPTYATIQKDTNYFSDQPLNECWFDVVFPMFNGRIHCTYYPINRQNTFDKLRSDAFELTDKHNVRATFIDQQPVAHGNVKGYIFYIDGPVATPLQFYLSDSTKHFLRGALYFNNHVALDSIQPVYEFIKQDVNQMVNTFAWKR